MCGWFLAILTRGRISVVQSTAQWVCDGIWMGELLPAFGTEVGKCIYGCDEDLTTYIINCITDTILPFTQ